MSGSAASFPSTLPAPPTTNDVALRILSMMAALSGNATDYTTGSQLRTYSLSAGAVIEMQSVAAQQQAYVGFTYGSIAAFGILPEGAQSASGYATFSTASAGTPPPAPQNVAIPSGTLIQTAGGIQFQTSLAGTLLQGNTSVTVPIIATVGGATGNVGIGQINTILTGLGYPLSVTNLAATVGGSAAETPSETLARFAAKTASLGLSSPVAVANSAIGVTFGGETVRFAACFEPWLYNLDSGDAAGSGQAGFILYVDNGTGAASSGLIANVIANLNGNASTNESGYRPAGVPFSVLPVNPVFASVYVSGSILPIVQGSVVEAAVQSSIQAYFGALAFEQSAQQTQIAAESANAGLGYFQSLFVALTYATGGAPLLEIDASYSQRVILSSINVNVQTLATT